jgi:hypothetical protein
MSGQLMYGAPILLVLWLALPFAAHGNEAATIKITQLSGVSAWWAGFGSVVDGRAYRCARNKVVIAQSHVRGC